MQFLEQEILEITEATWQSMLGLDIQVKHSPCAPEVNEGSLTGRVSISGSWNGVVLLQGSDKLSRSAAAAIFSKESSEVTEEDQQDAMYELSNIIAGNIKALLPEPCQLSLPTVHPSASVESGVTDHTRVSELLFDCQGEPLYVTVWQQS